MLVLNEDIIRCPSTYYNNNNNNKGGKARSDKGNETMKSMKKSRSACHKITIDVFRYTREIFIDLHHGRPCLMNFVATFFRNWPI